MINKCGDNYPVDKLWKLSLKINKRRFKGNKIKDIFDKITQERTGVKVTNLSAMMYLFNPKEYYCIDKRGAQKLLKLPTVDKDICQILERISGDVDGSYGWDEFSNIQKLCRDNKNIIGTPYQLYLNLH